MKTEKEQPNTTHLVKRFVKYYRPHKKLFALDMSMATIQSVYAIIMPLFVHQIINTYIPNNNIRMIVITLGIIFVISTIGAIAHYTNIKWGHILGVRIETTMRHALFQHLQKLSFSYFDKTKTGHIISRISNDLFSISELAHHAPEDLLISVVTMCGAFSFMFYLNPLYATIALIPMPLLLIWAMSYQKLMRSKYSHIRERIADINSSVENSIQGIREVKSFSNEKLELDKFHSTNQEFRFAKESMYSVMAAFHAGMIYIVENYILVILGGGIILINYGYADISTILVFLLYTRFIMNPIRRMTNFSEQFQQGAAAFERFIEVMDIEPEIADKENAYDLPNIKGDITLTNVHFKYNNDGEDILKDINIDIKSGETIALVGESGAGKSTLVALIPRFYEPHKGEIKIDSHNIMDITQASLRDTIGIVRQSPFLFDSTIADNILFGKPSATYDEMVQAAKQAHIFDFINSLPKKFDTLVGEHGVKLSGGQKQRISIARVFLKNPKILIFDEATSSLDTESESLIQEAMEQLCKGRTTIIIAHRLSTIKHADRIYVLRQGEVVETGTHDSLIAKKGYYYTLNQKI